LRKTIDASSALAQLTVAHQFTPNPTLFLDTITSTRKQRRFRNREHLFTTNDDLYNSYSGGQKLDNPATKEVISYKEALWKMACAI